MFHLFLFKMHSKNAFYKPLKRFPFLARKFLDQKKNVIGAEMAEGNLKKKEGWKSN